MASVIRFRPFALALVVVACADEPRPTTARAAASDTAATIAPATGDATFTTRTAILLLADSAVMARLRAEHGADFETVADDMMWYRAEALDFLETNAIPVVHFEGRRPLRFRVHGSEQEHDFGGLEYADVVVLYEPDSIPRAVAPIDVPTEAARYFGLE